MRRLPERFRREHVAPICSCCGAMKDGATPVHLAELKVLICLLAADRALDLYEIERVTGVCLSMVRRTVKSRLRWLFDFTSGGKSYRSAVRLSSAGEAVARAQLVWEPSL